MLGSKKDRGRPSMVDTLMVVACLCAVVVTLFRAVPETFGLGQEIGDLLFDLAVGYVAAWIFNLLVVVRPQRQRDAELHQVLNPKLQRLADVGRRLQTTLADAADDSDVTFPADQKKVVEMCAKVPADAPSGVVSMPRGSIVATPMSWGDYIDHVGRRSTAAHDEVSVLSPVLDPRLLAILERERSAMIHKNLGLVGSTQMGMETLEWCADEFAEFIQICADIEAYLAEKQPVT